MRLQFVAGALVALAVPGQAGAVELNGADVRLSYSQFIDDVETGPLGETDRPSRLTLGGQMEIGFTPTFALQADLAYHDFSDEVDDRTVATLHGVYHYDASLSVGAFAASDLDFYGIELRRDFIDWHVEGYVADADIDDLGSGLMLGVEGGYFLTPDLSVGASLDRASGDNGPDGWRAALATEYRFGPQGSVFAEVGTASVDLGGASSDGTFVEFGARYAIGAGRGATFGYRGLADLLPGG